MYSIVSWSYFELILWISKYKRINGNYFMIIFYLKTQRLILKSTLRNTSLIMDPFAQVKSAEDIVKSTTTLYVKKGCISLKTQTNKRKTRKALCCSVLNVTPYDGLVGEARGSSRSPGHGESIIFSIYHYLKFEAASICLLWTKGAEKLSKTPEYACAHG